MRGCVAGCFNEPQVHSGWLEGHLAFFLLFFFLPLIKKKKEHLSLPEFIWESDYLRIYLSFYTPCLATNFKRIFTCLEMRLSLWVVSLSESSRHPVCVFVLRWTPCSAGIGLKRLLCFLPTGKYLSLMNMGVFIYCLDMNCVHGLLCRVWIVLADIDSLDSFMHSLRRESLSKSKCVCVCCFVLVHKAV